jgi:hypothetical protein
MANITIPRPNAIDITVASEFGLIMLRQASGTITFRDGATEVTVYGFHPDQMPKVGDVVKIAGVALDRGHFFLPSAKCTAHGEGVLASAATFVQLALPGQ